MKKLTLVKNTIRKYVEFDQKVSPLFKTIIGIIIYIIIMGFILCLIK